MIYFFKTEADVVVRREADKFLFRGEGMRFISGPASIIQEVGTSTRICARLPSCRLEDASGR